MKVINFLKDLKKSLPLINMDPNDFLKRFTSQRRKDVTFSFYYGECAHGKYLDKQSLLKAWLGSVRRKDIGYGLIHIPELGDLPQYVVTFHGIYPSYYAIDYTKDGAKVAVAKFTKTESKNHLFDVITRIDGLMGLHTECVPYADINKLVSNIGFIRNNVNVENILRILEKNETKARLVGLRETSKFWTESSRNVICSVDLGKDMVGPNKLNLRFLQIDPKNIHGRNKLPSSGESTGIDLGYFWLYTSINKGKGTAAYYIEIHGCSHKTLPRR